jgi:hypothetical protein
MDCSVIQKSYFKNMNMILHFIPALNCWHYLVKSCWDEGLHITFCCVQFPLKPFGNDISYNSFLTYRVTFFINTGYLYGNMSIINMSRRSSWMWQLTVWQMFTYLEKYAAFIFRIEYPLFYCQDWGSAFLQNVINHLLGYTASQPRRE